MRLANKVAIITGSASGMGQAAAELFANEGACIVVTDVATDLDNLASLLHNTSREWEAKELEEQAKSIRNKKKTL